MTTNDVTFRITLTYDEALVMEKVLAGITPSSVDELDTLAEIETRFLKNLDRHRANELLRKSREAKILEDLVNLREIARPNKLSETDALETIKQMAISKGEYRTESDESDHNSHDDAG